MVGGVLPDCCDCAMSLGRNSNHGTNHAFDARMLEVDCVPCVLDVEGDSKLCLEDLKVDCRW
jgi:hypothetical protein